MVKYKHLIRTIEDYCEKTHLTIQQNKERLRKWSVEEKKALLKYGVADYDKWEYDYILQNGTKEEIWEYERQIIDNITKGRQDNIVKYLTGFHEKEYNEDIQRRYPSSYCGECETRQGELQEKIGYPKGFRKAINTYWGGGYFQEIQDKILGKETDNTLHFLVEKGIIESTDIIIDYIGTSEGLVEDTVLWRGGHWDEHLKVGDVKEIPCLNSTSYQKDVAYEIGIDEVPEKNNYLIQIYAPQGTKGIYANSSSLLYDYPEHEYLLGKGQKYIVLNVDDTSDPKTATIKLIND